MAYVSKRGIWRPDSVPNFPVEIAWGHPLANGLLGCYVPGSPHGLSDIARIGPTLTPSASSAWKSTPAGYGADSTASSSGFFATAPDVYKNSLGSNASWLWSGQAFARAPSTGFTAILFGISAHSTDTSPYLASGVSASAASTNGTVFVAILTGQGANFFNLSSKVWSDYSGLQTTIVGTYGSSTTLLYGNGTQLLSGSFTSPISFFSDSQLWMGGYPAQVNRRSASPCTIGAVWNRTLTQDESQWLTLEPFAMLQPQVAKRYYIPASAPPPSAQVTISQILRL